MKPEKQFQSGLLYRTETSYCGIQLSTKENYTQKLNYDYLRKRVKFIFEKENKELPYAEDIQECLLTNVTLTEDEIIDVDPRMIFPMKEAPKYFDFTGGEPMDGTDDICKNRYNHKV